VRGELLLSLESIRKPHLCYRDSLIQNHCKCVIVKKNKKVCSSTFFITDFSSSSVLLDFLMTGAENLPF